MNAFNNIILNNDELKKQITPSSYYYLGNAAENILSAMLMKENYDVMKPSVDCGIDLIAINNQNIIDRKHQTLYFQVKSKSVKISKKPNSQRPCAIDSIEISSSTINLMKRLGNNSGLFIFLYDNYNSSKYLPKDFISINENCFPFLYCWLRFDDLSKLSGLDYVYENNSHPDKIKRRKISGEYYNLYFKVTIPYDLNRKKPIVSKGKDHPCIIISNNNADFDKHYDILNGGKGKQHYTLKGFLETVT